MQDTYLRCGSCGFDWWHEAGIDPAGSTCTNCPTCEDIVDLPVPVPEASESEPMCERCEDDHVTRAATAHVTNGRISLAVCADHEDYYTLYGSSEWWQRHYDAGVSA